MYGEPILYDNWKYGISNPVAPVLCASNCPRSYTREASCCPPVYTPKCGSISSIDGVCLEECSEINFCNSSLIKLSFDECNYCLCAELDVCGLLQTNIVRGGVGISVTQKLDPISGCYYELNNISKYSIGGVMFTGGYNQDPNWFNLCITSSDNSIEVSKEVSDSCNGGYTLDLKSRAAGMGSAIIWKDLASLADFGCEQSNPGGPLTVVIDGFDVKCVSNSEVRLIRKFKSITSINNVTNNGGDISFVSADKSIVFTPNDSSNTINAAVRIRSTDTAKLNITRDVDGTFVLDPSGSNPNSEWTEFTVTPTATTTSPDFGAGTGAIAKGQYKINADKQLQAVYNLTFGNSFGTGSYELNLPFPSNTSALKTLGHFTVYDSSGTARNIGNCEVNPNSNKLQMFANDGTPFTQLNPYTIAVGDQVWVSIEYRIS